MLINCLNYRGIYSYLNHAVFSFHPNLIYYFSGQITAHLILSKRVLVPSSSASGRKFKIVSLVLFVTFFTTGQYFTSLYTVFKVIPDGLIPMYMVVHKIVWTLAFVSGAVYFNLVFGKNNSDRKVSKNGNVSKSDRLERRLSRTGRKVSKSDLNRCSFWKGMTRLTFSLYFINYIVIRTHFFNCRSSYDRTFYDMTTTVMHVHVYSVFVAFFFHLWFIAPFHNLIRNGSKLQNN